MSFHVRVTDYRLTKPLGRGKLLSLGAALVAAGISIDCESEGRAVAMYGAPCTPPECAVPATGGAAGGGGTAAGVGGVLAGNGGTAGPSAGEAGEAGRGGGSGEGNKQP